jgi:hypothetical protein
MSAHDAMEFDAMRMDPVPGMKEGFRVSYKQRSHITDAQRKHLKTPGEEAPPRRPNAPRRRQWRRWWW